MMNSKYNHCYQQQPTFIVYIFLISTNYYIYFSHPTDPFSYNFDSCLEILQILIIILCLQAFKI